MEVFSGEFRIGSANVAAPMAGVAVKNRHSFLDLLLRRKGLGKLAAGLQRGKDLSPLRLAKLIIGQSAPHLNAQTAVVLAEIQLVQRLISRKKRRRVVHPVARSATQGLKLPLAGGGFSGIHLEFGASQRRHKQAAKASENLAGNRLPLPGLAAGIPKDLQAASSSTIEIDKFKCMGAGFQNAPAFAPPHAVRSIVVHYKLAIDVYCRAVVRMGRKAVFALLRRQDLAVETERVMVGSAAEGKIESNAFQGSFLSRFQRGEVGQALERIRFVIIDVQPWN